MSIKASGPWPWFSRLLRLSQGLNTQGVPWGRGINWEKKWATEFKRNELSVSHYDSDDEVIASADVLLEVLHADMKEGICMTKFVNEHLNLQSFTHEKERIY